MTFGGTRKAENAESLEGEQTHRALRNAGVLGVSLMATWSVALLVRLLLPRYLGPTSFGALHFADYFSQGFLVITALGVDTYIRKEVPTRPSHASDFFGGILVLRILIGALLIAPMFAILHFSGRDSKVFYLVLLFGLAHFLLCLNQSFGALLQARGEVKGLAITNFVVKVGWGVSVVGGLVCGAPLWFIPTSLLVAEAFKSFALLCLSKRHLSLSLAIYPAPTKMVMIASLPFFFNMLAQTLYDKIDVSMIGVMGGNKEAGYYGAATILTAAALMLTPIISSVLIPHSSLAAARSQEALQKVMDGALKLSIIMILPVSFLLIAGAEIWVNTLFGNEFSPSIPALRIRAASLVLTYLATLSAIHLIQMGSLWTVTVISLFALAISPILNLCFIQIGINHLGEGGAGTGAALASLVGEVLVVALMQYCAGQRAMLKSKAGWFLRALWSCVFVSMIVAVAGSTGLPVLAICIFAWIPLGFVMGVYSSVDVLFFIGLIKRRVAK